MSHEQDPQLPTNVPKTPTTQRVAPQASLLNSTPLNRGTPTQDGEASSLLVKFVDPLLYDDLKDHQVASFENVLKELIWQASTKSADQPPEDLSTDDFCTALLTDALNKVILLCNRDASPTIFANLDAYLSEEKETDRYVPFINATNEVLEKLEGLNVEGLKEAPKGSDRIIFLVNHPNIIPIRSGDVASHRKPDVVIMRLDDAARTYSSSQSQNDWGQLKIIAQKGAKPQNFRRILSCVEFKAEKFDRTMEDYPRDGTQPLHDTEPMHIVGDVLARKAAKRSESQATKSGSESLKRKLKDAEFANEPDSQPRSTKRAAGSGRAWYPRPGKESQTPPGVAQSKQTTGFQTKTPQEKTSENKTRDPILQAGSYAVEMISMSRVHVWNVLIIDQRVHLWYYDRQGGIQSYGLDIIKNLPHFFVLLLAFQRLDLREWGYASGLSFDKDNQYSARMDVTLHIPAVNSDASSQQSTPSVNFTDNQALRRYWGLVGRATAVYVCNLTGRPIEEQVVKLSWPEVTRKPEPEILKELESILDDEVKGHVPVLLASQMPPTMNTGLIRQRLQAKQPQCTEARGPRQLVVTVTRKLRPVWDLTADELFDVWIQCILCHIVLWRKGYHHRDISPANIMYYRDGDRVVGVLNDWDLATALSASSIPNTDRTGTIPFMALQLLSIENTVHLLRHDAESFIWVFLWVCGCSNGSGKEVPVAPYKTWRHLDMFTCKKERGDFLSAVELENINVSTHHGPNGYFCLFLTHLLQQLRTYVWMKFSTSADHDAKDNKDFALLETVLIPKFKEVRSTLNQRFSPGDWSSEERRIEIQRYIRITVTSTIDTVEAGSISLE